jgi:hypothetical protein
MRQFLIENFVINNRPQHVGRSDAVHARKEKPRQGGEGGALKALVCS